MVTHGTNRQYVNYESSKGQYNLFKMFIDKNAVEFRNSYFNVVHFGLVKSLYVVDKPPSCS